MLNTAERTFSIMGRVPSPGGDSSRLHGTGRKCHAVLMSSFLRLNTSIASFTQTLRKYPSKCFLNLNNKLERCCAVPMATRALKVSGALISCWPRWAW